MQEDVKVLLVDDHAVVRSGLRALLENEPGIRVVGEASNGKEAIELVKEKMPDVVVMDIRMPELNGVDAARQALAIHPRVKIIGLSADANDRLAVELLRAGAIGYLRKESAYSELIAAIRAAMQNHMYCNSAVINRMFQQQAGGRQHDSAFDTLSQREREHLQLIAEGKSTKEIALTLQISLKTAETHRRNLLAKLNVKSVAELTKYAVREGLTSL
jgi:DNA-binding NarL/FixJ family response regulator